MQASASVPPPPLREQRRAHRLLAWTPPTPPQFRQISFRTTIAIRPPRCRPRIDTAAEKDIPLVLPPGKFIVSDLRLRAGTRLIGTARTTTLAFAGGAAFVTADKADGLVLDGLTLEGAYKAFDVSRGDGLITITRCKHVRLVDLDIRNSVGIGLSLVECAGRINGISISSALDAGLKSLDSKGLDISGNTVTDCGNNGILVWRSHAEEDGTVISGNRISKIRNAAGGTGEYGNGINVFRAGSVLVTGNRISEAERCIQHPDHRQQLRTARGSRALRRIRFRRRARTRHRQHDRKMLRRSAFGDRLEGDFHA